MFGTVALMKPRSGQEQAVVAMLDKWWSERRPAVKALEDRLQAGEKLPFATRETEIVVHVSKLAKK